MSGNLDQLSHSVLASLPAASPPPGVLPDFNGHGPLAYTITVVASVFIGLMFVFLGIRTYAKVKIHRAWSWDDVTCAIGVISTVAYWIVALLQVENEGFGRHLWNVPLSVFISEDFLKLAYISSWLSNLSYNVVKLTLFILYWNIFHLFRWLKYGIVGGAIVVTGVHTAFVLYIIIEDSPRPGQSWLDKSIADPNSGAIRLAIPLSAWALVTDVYILLLPIMGVLRLQLSSGRRLGLLMVFMTGIGACVCSSLSIYYRTFLDYDDVTYTVIKIQALAIVELCVGIIITCVPTTSVFLRNVLPPKKTLRLRSITIYEKLMSRLHLSQRNSSAGSESKKSKAMDVHGPYKHMGDGESAVKLGTFPAHHMETRITAQDSVDQMERGIHVRTELDQV
ncbi:MAG: hypothetical protein Q9174_002368 [Haloplaca sp. 1 TL-2023]